MATEHRDEKERVDFDDWLSGVDTDRRSRRAFAQLIGAVRD